VTLEEIEEMKLIFEIIDFDHSGYINRYKLNRMNMVSVSVSETLNNSMDNENEMMGGDDESASGRRKS
jgi:Ca2+-binding EF-hand superfamily protein